MEPSRGQQSPAAREGAGADRGHGEPGLPWAQPTVRTTSARGSRGPPVGVRSWGSEFTWLTEMPQDQGEQSGRTGSRLRAAVCSGEVGTAGEERGQRLEKCLLGRRAGEKSAVTTRAPSSLTQRSFRGFPPGEGQNCVPSPGLLKGPCAILHHAMPPASLHRGRGGDLADASNWTDTRGLRRPQTPAPWPACRGPPSHTCAGRTLCSPSQPGHPPPRSRPTHLWTPLHCYRMDAVCLSLIFYRDSRQFRVWDHISDKRPWWAHCRKHGDVG